MSVKIAVIIPAYNEEDCIKTVIDDINTVEMNDVLLIPIVVNDCSTDNTGKIIETANCTSLTLPVNLGIGGAVQAGFIYAYTNHFDYAIQVDGDGQHPASEIPRLVEAIINNNCDVVIGSRFVSNSGFQSTFTRRAGIGFFKYLNKMLIGLTIHDCTSGFRIVNRKALKLVNAYYPDEYPEPESIILFAQNKLSIMEIQVEMRARQGGISSIGAFSSVYYMFKVSLAIIFTFLRSKFFK